MNIQDLKNYVENNPHLVDVKSSIVYPEYSVIKYKKKVFWDNLWSPELERCRGLVIDRDWNVISRPFNKMYNFGIEDRAPKLKDTDMVQAMRKVNGFMAAITWDKKNDNILISTTGSLDSDHVNMIRDRLRDHVHMAPSNFMNGIKDLHGETHLFECVHPDDPHIIHEHVSGLYYLGTMKNNIEDDAIYTNQFVKMWFHNPETYALTVADMLKLVKVVKHEGFVFNSYSSDADTIVTSKIKSPYYLVKKFFARKTAVTEVVSNMARQIFDEEYYPLIEHINVNIEKFNSLSEFGRLNFIEEFLGG